MGSEFFMFDREHFWENTGHQFATNYLSPTWVKKSRFIALQTKG
jgi:hypothetical protein